MKFNCQYFNSTLQKGVRSSAFRDFSQIERFTVKWDDTDPVSCVLLIEWGGFFKTKKILPRQTVEELNGVVGKFQTALAMKALAIGSRFWG